MDRSCGASRHSRASPSDKQIAALRGHQRVQLVEHDALQRRKQKRRVVGRQQQRQLLRRGEQDVRRIAPLPLPPRHRGVAGAGFDLDRQRHLGDRGFQIARDIDRQRLQRRNVERMQAAAALLRRVRWRRVFCHLPAQGKERKAPPASAGTRPASCRPRWARSAASNDRPGLLPATPVDARGATSRGLRTSAGRFPAAVEVGNRDPKPARPRRKPSESSGRGRLRNAPGWSGRDPERPDTAEAPILCGFMACRVSFPDSVTAPPQTGPGLADTL